MSSQHENLHVLNNILPDPQNQLFHPPLEGFTLFNQLPTELRCRIWHLCRGRKVNLTAWGNIYITPSNKVPVTLQVNHESRSETRKHYLVRDTGLQGPVTNRSFEGALPFSLAFVDPEVDTMCLRNVICSALSMAHDFVSKVCDVSIPGDNERRLVPLCESWSRIKYLEISGANVDWNDFKEDRGETWLRYFWGLRELVIIGDQVWMDWGLGTEEGRKDCKEALQEFFKLEKELRPETKIPEIIVRLATETEKKEERLELMESRRRSG